MDISGYQLNSKLTEIQSCLIISLATATATDAATAIDKVGHSCGHKIILKSSLNMGEKIKVHLVQLKVDGDSAVINALADMARPTWAVK